MGNLYYQPGEQRAARVKALFGRIAPQYDLLNDLQSFGLHRFWKRRLIRLAAPGAGEQALDVCCGTGDLALALARQGTQVTGLDFSDEMLEVARHKARTWSKRSALSVAARPEAQGGLVSNGKAGTLEAAAADFRPPDFIRGDALELPFRDASFDLVTVGYGLRNLASWELGLSEMRRVARPGGRLLVLDFGKPENALWRSVYFGYLRLFVPVLGWLFCGDASAYAYILESLKHYPAQQGVEAWMAQSGLTHVRTVQFLGGVMSINYGRRPTLPPRVSPAAQPAQPSS